MKIFSSIHRMNLSCSVANHLNMVGSLTVEYLLIYSDYSDTFAYMRDMYNDLQFGHPWRFKFGVNR